MADGVYDEVDGHEVDHRIAVADLWQRHMLGHADEQLKEVVGAIILIGLPGARVADDDPWSEDRGGDRLLATLKLDLCPELGLLVVVLKLLLLIKLSLKDGARALARDVAGGDVVKPPKLRRLLAQIEDVDGAGDVDAVGQGLGDG